MAFSRRTGIIDREEEVGKVRLINSRNSCFLTTKVSGDLSMWLREWIPNLIYGDSIDVIVTKIFFATNRRCLAISNWFNEFIVKFMYGQHSFFVFHNNLTSWRRTRRQSLCSKSPLVLVLGLAKPQTVSRESLCLQSNREIITRTRATIVHPYLAQWLEALCKLGVIMIRWVCEVIVVPIDIQIYQSYPCSMDGVLWQHLSQDKCIARRGTDQNCF